MLGVKSNPVAKRDVYNFPKTRGTTLTEDDCPRNPIFKGNGPKSRKIVFSELVTIQKGAPAGR